VAKRIDKDRVARVAGRQFGRISRAQLRDIGVSDVTVRGWCDQGYLHRVLPRVYAVGHRGKTTEADLATALLYAGPGAMLSHVTAAWWVGLAVSKPYMIHVSTPRACQSIPGVRIHPRRRLKRDWHKDLPVTEFPQTMLDYAATASLTNVRAALARADFGGELNVAAIEPVLKRGSRGSTRLREALKRHQPMLAQARSGLEVQLFELCKSANFPLPELNAEVAGWPVDALWRKERIAVELDGPGNHRTPAQIRRDRRKEFELRKLNFIVPRYSDEQMDHQPHQVIDELGRFLAARAQAA
jgi:predicted transcriptional regulator of viral defense system